MDWYSGEGARGISKTAGAPGAVVVAEDAVMASKDVSSKQLGPIHHYEFTRHTKKAVYDAVRTRANALLVREVIDQIFIGSTCDYLGLQVTIVTMTASIVIGEIVTTALRGITIKNMFWMMIMSNEKEFLDYIDATNCDQFVESDVFVQWRIRSYRYKVYVKSQQCHERKVPFASAGKPGQNAFQDFLDDIRLHIALRDCRSVVKFVGVVLDDDRLHLKSYLLEYPMLINLKVVLGIADSRSETIPWPIREAWARQIINAIVDVHSKGAVLGVLRLNWFGVRADGTAVLVLLKGSGSYLENRFGEMPPELRNNSQIDGIAARKKLMNFQTDIFQLGLTLWLLVEHKPWGQGYFCARSVCTHYPRYACEANHSNPVELPEIRGKCPPYLHKIIRLCRSQDPKARPSARKLAKVIEGTEEPDTHMIDIDKLLRTYARAKDTVYVYCSECGALTTEDYFNCNVCDGGEFDICPGCYSQKIRCYDSEHQLRKWIMRNDLFVDVS